MPFYINVDPVKHIEHPDEFEIVHLTDNNRIVTVQNDFKKNNIPIVTLSQNYVDLAQYTLGQVKLLFFDFNKYINKIIFSYDLIYEQIHPFNFNKIYENNQSDSQIINVIPQLTDIEDSKISETPENQKSPVQATNKAAKKAESPAKKKSRVQATNKAAKKNHQYKQQIR